jgi:hypothetical protein
VIKKAYASKIESGYYKFPNIKSRSKSKQTLTSYRPYNPKLHTTKERDSLIGTNFSSSPPSQRPSDHFDRKQKINISTNSLLNSQIKHILSNSNIVNMMKTNRDRIKVSKRGSEIKRESGVSGNATEFASSPNI